MDRFKTLIPQLGRIEPLGGEGQTNCWEAYDKAGGLIGYAFAAVAPEAAADAAELEDMDRYAIVGLVSSGDYKVIALDVSLAPGSSDNPWDPRITGPEFENQYVGLTAEEIRLSPEGRIDAISDATLSSRWVTEAVHQRVKDIIERTARR